MTARLSLGRCCLTAAASFSFFFFAPAEFGVATRSRCTKHRVQGGGTRVSHTRVSHTRVWACK